MPIRLGKLRLYNDDVDHEVVAEALLQAIKDKMGAEMGSWPAMAATAAAEPPPGAAAHF